MKKCINGLIYDTEKATKLVDWISKEYSPLRKITTYESLWKGKEGHFFLLLRILFLESEKTTIIPLTQFGVQKWLEENDQFNLLKEHFNVQEA